MSLIDAENRDKVAQMMIRCGLEVSASDGIDDLLRKVEKLLRSERLAPPQKNRSHEETAALREKILAFRRGGATLAEAAGRSGVSVGYASILASGLRGVSVSRGRIKPTVWTKERKDFLLGCGDCTLPEIRRRIIETFGEDFTIPALESQMRNNNLPFRAMKRGQKPAGHPRPNYAEAY